MSLSESDTRSIDRRKLIGNKNSKQYFVLHLLEAKVKNKYIYATNRNKFYEHIPKDGNLEWIASDERTFF